MEWVALVGYLCLIAAAAFAAHERGRRKQLEQVIDIIEVSMEDALDKDRADQYAACHFVLKRLQEGL